MRTRNYMLVAWLVLPMVGCASLNDSHYETTQLLRTRAAWRSVPDCAKQQRFPHDYELGWRDGYYDVLTGGKGCPPVVAPERYWKPSQILDDCDNRRHAYYSGFQDGAACALRQPDTHHLKMWSSCECPLPSCEPCCPTAKPACSHCPTGDCGMRVDGGLDGMIEPMMEMPMSQIVEPTQPTVPTTPAAVAPAAKPMVTLPVAASTPKSAPGFPLTTDSMSKPTVKMAAPLLELGLIEQESAPTTRVTVPVPARTVSVPVAFNTSEGMIEDSVVRMAAPIKTMEPATKNGPVVKQAAPVQMNATR